MKLMALKQDGVNYVLCAKQGNKIEDAVLHTQVMYFRIFLTIQSCLEDTPSQHYYVGRTNNDQDSRKYITRKR